MEIAGSSSTTNAKATGGVYDGEKLSTTLVLEGSTWKLDSLKSNVPVGP